MDRQNDCISSSIRVLAQEHYDQALVMIFDGHLQEAMEELEKASQLRPACEVYQETLAQLKMSCNLSHPTVTDFEHDWADLDRFCDTRSQQATDANPSHPYDREHPGHCKETTVNNVNGTREATATCTPNGKSSTKLSFKKSSPIDGLSRTELPEGYPDLLQKSGKLESEQVPAQKTKDSISSSSTTDLHDSSTFCSSVPTNISTFQDSSDPEISSKTSSRSHETRGMASSDFKREHLNNIYRDHISGEGSGLDSDEGFEDKFLEQLCKARETCDVGWDKYLEMLNEICIENSDAVLPEMDFPVSSSSRDFSGIDDSDDQHPGSTRMTTVSLDGENPSFNSSRSSTRTKGGSNLYRTAQMPAEGDRHSVTDTEKERVYFVNGSCYSSSHPPRNPCPQPREDVSAKAGKEKQHMHRTDSLSASEKDFYNNLGKYYFGGGKVKYKKEMSKESDGKYVEETGSYHTEKQSESGFVGSARLGRHSQGLGTGLQSPLVQEENSAQFTVLPMPTSKVDCDPGKGRVKSKAKCSSPNARNTGLEGTEEPKVPKNKDKRTATSNSVKEDLSGEAHRKLPVHGSQMQDKVHMPRGIRPAYPEQTGRRHKGKVRHRARNVRGVVVNSTSVDQEKQDASRECGASDETTDFQSKKMNFQSVQVWLQKSGKQFAASCGQTAISVLQYVMVLAMLLMFGFLILPLSYGWYVVCRVCNAIVRKVKELCTSLRNFAATKILPWFGWFMGLFIRLFLYFGWFKNLLKRKSPEAKGFNLSMTGDEAVLKMISGKDKGPYSILGVSHDASEDDIRRHYRRLAVLIHPDKNDHPQADEAFKILADAFGQIGTSEKRMAYDMEAACKSDEHRFGDDNRGPRNIFSELHKQMKEMQNYLSCDVCGAKHRRYKTERPVSFARFCSHCDTRHGGKQGELWAESSYFGMKVYFYACMDNAIYDVTEWAACQGLHQRRIQTDTHNAPWKIKSPSSNSYPFKSEEELFNDFLREMFFRNHFPPGDDRHGAQNKTRKRKRKKRR